MPRLPILVVEDDDNETFALKALLAQFDYIAVSVKSGEEALAYLKNIKVSAILMDLSLPGMDGFECAKKIREQFDLQVPIIALTGRTDDQSVKLAFEVGMTSFLTKPFDIEELRKLLLRHVYDPDRPNLKTLSPVEVEQGNPQELVDSPDDQ